MAYTEEQIEETFNRIIKHIEEGNSLRSALRLDDMPSSQTFFVWVEECETKSKQYAQACESRSDLMFEDLLKIADDGTNDYMTITKGDISYNVEDKEVVNRSKLRADVRKWMLSKMNPKKYSDKLQVEQGKLQGQQITGMEIVNVPPEHEEKG